MRICFSVVIAVAGIAFSPLSATANVLRRQRQGPPNVLSTEKIVESFKNNIKKSEKWVKATSNILGDPARAPAPPIPVGSPENPLGFVSFLNQLSGGSTDVRYGSASVPSFAAEFSVPRVPSERPEIVFRVGDRGLGDDRDAIRLDPLHLVSGSAPISVGSSVAYKTSGKGLSIWGSTDDGAGQKEWI
mmetsp:Transcript_20849/g.39083  ORF Transcript_20849/g.39083 Transcript_20849/m.39083 type:complete len:188 (-) Transcript_20849:118-681(-)